MKIIKLHNCITRSLYFLRWVNGGVYADPSKRLCVIVYVQTHVHYCTASCILLNSQTACTINCTHIACFMYTHDKVQFELKKRTTSEVCWRNIHIFLQAYISVQWITFCAIFHALWLYQGLSRSQSQRSIFRISQYIIASYPHSDLKDLYRERLFHFADNVAKNIYIAGKQLLGLGQAKAEFLIITNVLGFELMIQLKYVTVHFITY